MKKFRMRKPNWKKAAAPAFLATLALACLNGCGNSDQFVFTNSPQAVVARDAPTAVADQYLALGNTTMTVNAPQGVLSNDSDFADATLAVVTEPTNGTLTLNQDGSFSYTTPVGFTGQTSFTYSLTNDIGTSEAQVTITVNQLAWFVNNSGPAGNGSSSSPFADLKAAETASAAGDTIFVFAGDGTDSGQDEGIVLKPNQLLLSEREGLTFQNGAVARTDISAQIAPNQVIVPADPGVRPVISNSTGVGVELAENNSVRGFQIENTANEGILASNLTPTPGHKISDNVVTSPGSGSSAIRLEALSGTTLIEQNTLSGVDATDALYLSTGFSGSDNPNITVDGNSFEDGVANDPEAAARMELLDLGAATGSPSVTFSFTDNDVSGESGTGFESALIFGAVLNDLPLGSGVIGQFNVSVNSNTVDGTDEEGFFLDLDGGDTLAGSVALALSVDGNGFENTGDDAIQIYLESKVDATGTISNNTKTSGDGGGIDVRSGRNSTDETSSELTIAENSITANGATKRGIQVRAEGSSVGESTVFCINNTLTDDGDAISGYRIQSANDATLTVVCDGGTIAGFLTNGLVATARDTSTLLVAVRNGDYTGGTEEGVFIEGVHTGATICAQVLNNTFDSFRIRQNAGQNPLVQLEALPATTTLDTNTGMITVGAGVTEVNLGDCNIPATPTP